MFFLKLLFKNAFRHRLRAWLTILSIAIAILAFGLLRTVISAWYAGVDMAASNRLVTRNAVSMTFSLPLAYKEKIRQVQGVKKVTYASWFGGIYIEEKNFFPSFAGDFRTYLDLYPEYVLAPDQLEALYRDRKGFAAGKKLADRFGWKIGDTVVLKGSIYPGNWEFVLRAIYRGRDRNVDETMFLFHWDYLNEGIKKSGFMRPDQVGFYLIGIERPEDAADTAAAIDAVFKNSLAETLTETEKAFNMSFISMSEAIVIVIQLVSLAVIIIIIAVAANTMSMTVRERIGEFAVFKTLGFGAFRIAVLIFGESLVITLAGALFGILFTFPAAKAFGSSLGMYFPIFRVAPETIYLDIAAGLIIGLLAALIPTWRAIGIRIADGLRRIA